MFGLPGCALNLQCDVLSAQALMHDTSRKRVMALLVHGDASFAGLGIVLEVR